MKGHDDNKITGLRHARGNRSDEEGDKKDHVHHKKQKKDLKSIDLHYDVVGNQPLQPYTHRPQPPQIDAHGQYHQNRIELHVGHHEIRARSPIKDQAAHQRKLSEQRYAKDQEEELPVFRF